MACSGRKVAKGQTHVWIQDVMVSPGSRHSGIGSQLIAEVREASREAGYTCLHVDFEDHLSVFYFQACGFRPRAAGLINLQE
jgi:predicted N-acetyltransferase YhbS